MSKKLRKISFRKGGDGGVVIGYETFGNNGKRDDTKKIAKHPPHETFITAMQGLKKHVMLIAEWNGELADKYKNIGSFKPDQAVQD